MSTGSLSFGFFDEKGRVRGAFVYMLLCSDNGPIYAKVGYTSNPENRLRQLRTGMTINPDVFALCRTPGIEMAKRIERALHLTLQKWAYHHEWFRFSESDRAEFNAAWQDVFSKHAPKGWPLKWHKLKVSDLDAQAEKRRRFFQHKWKRAGIAYRDYLRDAG